MQRSLAKYWRNTGCVRSTMALYAVARPKVLLVELHDDSRPLGVILERGDHDVLTADSADGARDIARQVELDLVLIDSPLPAHDGVKVCAALAKLSGGTLPIVLLSSGLDGDTLVAAFEAGAVDYLHKPIERGELLARVGRHIERARLARSLARENDELRERNRVLTEQLERSRDGLESAAAPLTLNLNAVKEQLIGQALQQTQGNITAAARILGVHRSWFYRRKSS